MVKNQAASAGDIRNLGSIPGFGRSLGEGNGNPLQPSCLENPTDRGAWWATVHEITKNWTRLSNWVCTQLHLSLRRFLWPASKQVLEWSQPSSLPLNHHPTPYCMKSSLWGQRLVIKTHDTVCFQTEGLFPPGRLPGYSFSSPSLFPFKK